MGVLGACNVLSLLGLPLGVAAAAGGASPSSTAALCLELFEPRLAELGGMSVRGRQFRGGATYSGQFCVFHVDADALGARESRRISWFDRVV